MGSRCRFGVRRGGSLPAGIRSTQGRQYPKRREDHQVNGEPDNYQRMTVALNRALSAGGASVQAHVTTDEMRQLVHPHIAQLYDEGKLTFVYRGDIPER